MIILNVRVYPIANIVLILLLLKKKEYYYKQRNPLQPKVYIGLTTDRYKYFIKIMIFYKLLPLI